MIKLIYTGLISLILSSTAYAQLKVTDWMSKTGPLYPHSAIIEGETEIGIVDVQQSKSEALRLIADVLEKGKEVKWIYVTHPHLDHFAGANYFKIFFPKAKFYSVKGANEEMVHQVKTRRLPLGQSTPGGANNLPETAPNYFLTLKDKETLSLNNQKVEILYGKGDHPFSSIVWIPSAKTIVAGDVIFNQIHAFFGDHNDIDAWINLVERAKALNPEVVIAGHSKTPNPSGIIVAEQLQWLKDLKQAMKTNDTWQYVKEQMVSKYPTWGNDFIFEFSYGVRKK
jgi:glyoxylase-like metal-dependent hydrolase (beta-lactamase superfamily II)